MLRLTTDQQTYNDQKWPEFENSSNYANDGYDHADGTSHYQDGCSTQNGASSDEGIVLVCHKSPNAHSQYSDAQNL